MTREHLLMFVSSLSIFGLWFMGQDYPGAWWLGYYADALALVTAYTIFYLVFRADQLPGYYLVAWVPPMTSMILVLWFDHWVLLTYMGIGELQVVLDLLVSVWWVDLVMFPGLVFDVLAVLVSPVRWALSLYLAAGGALR